MSIWPYPASLDYYGSILARSGGSYVLDLEAYRREWPEPEAEPEPVEPMKQNGRSAAYLAFDPTKAHRRRR